MGKLEKVVVLTVLFLVAVILGVSLNAEKGVAGASSGPMAPTTETAQAPGKGADTAPRAARKQQKKAPETEQPRQRPQGPAGVLNASLGTAETADAQPQPEQPEEIQAYILTLAGLEPSMTEDLMIYTWREGDSFTSLADLYYGSRMRVHRLRNANEGRNEAQLRPGDQILVPVLPAPSEEVVSADGETPKKTKKQKAWKGGTTYTVQSGDVLGTISQTVYGTSKHWRKIYDANRDVLADPNSLTVGTELRIPE